MKITNQWQYRHAKAQVGKFSEVLASETFSRMQGDPRLVRAQREGLESERAALEAEIAAYEQMKRKRRKDVRLELIDQVPEALIAARLAAGLTQAELAARLGMKPQQIQRYEATRYASASLARLREVAAALTATSQIT
jgi:ribosome-binding protein aMBF1 (putative translation factor)